MREAAVRSLRFAVDLQACQTGASAQRGVGRYSENLFKALVAAASDVDIRAIVNSSLSQREGAKFVNVQRAVDLAPLPAYPDTPTHKGGDRNWVDDCLHSAATSHLHADVMHVSHVFEGWGERVPLPSHTRRPEGQLVTATLYDLIPLRFKHHYFENRDFKKWYLSRMDWLRHADLLLAISESSRQDAINLLGVDPNRIITVWGGISGHFQVADDDALRRRPTVLRTLGIPDQFILYTGGDDFRKNIGGLITAYSKLPSRLRANYPLVIVCSMEEQRRDHYHGLARRNGLDKIEVIFTGYIDEQQLVALYQACSLFVFPSLYEGLGLPVLEAMACGAPVIGGENSSISEIVVRKDALFDANSADAIAQRMTEVLTTPGLAETLRTHGQQRASKFNWASVARTALSGFDHALERTRKTGVQCALSGWQPKLRMAMFTPLPPAKSGIADYNAQFLPYLSRHFNIDLYVAGESIDDDYLNASFRLFKVEDFDRCADRYDVILYELGNSEFHVHMLPLLAKYPGVVGLHDAFLSGLIGYIDFNLGHHGSYANRMIASHGTMARRLFAPVQACTEPNGESMVNLPCTKDALDNAVGIISHSRFNLDTARHFFPERWQACYRVIRQVVQTPPMASDSERRAARQALGYGDNDVLITTFGHIAWTKWGDRLLDAFNLPDLRDDARIHFIFAGELAQDHFGLTLGERVRHKRFRDRVRITGFLSGAAYEQYLIASDVAIQLRTKSRGGTPKGVMDCLAYRLPVVVNDDASYRDYPDDVVVKLSANPEPEEIAQCLQALAMSATRRSRFAEAGRSYVATLHNPEQIAAEYASAITEMTARYRASQHPVQMEALTPYLGAVGIDVTVVNGIENWIAARHVNFSRPRLYVDVSHIAQLDHNTGIQRVVKEIVKALYVRDFPGLEPVAVRLDESGRLLIAREWLIAQGLLAATDPQNSGIATVDFAPGDVLLMLDSSWERFREFYPAFEQARRHAVPIITAIYDLLPLVLPRGNFVEGGPEWFGNWFREAARSSDQLLCISRSVMEDVERWLDGNTHEYQRRPRASFWHLGSDYRSGPSGTLNSVIELPKALIKTPYMLMVGTIEPRKSHALALDAFERLWAESAESTCLCIVGKRGWMVDELMQRLADHPMRDKRLVHLESASDDMLAALYANARALLMLSKGEGFGLPLVEAAHFGTPIICSDIPVFREIAGTHATYVSLGNAETLAGELASWIAADHAGTRTASGEMRRLSWSESAEMLIDAIGLGAQSPHSQLTINA